MISRYIELFDQIFNHPDELVIKALDFMFDY